MTKIKINKSKVIKTISYLVIAAIVCLAGYWTAYNFQAVKFTMTNPEAVSQAADYYYQLHHKANVEYSQTFFISPLADVR